MRRDPLGVVLAVVALVFGVFAFIWAIGHGSVFMAILAGIVLAHAWMAWDASKNV